MGTKTDAKGDSKGDVMISAKQLLTYAIHKIDEEQANQLLSGMPIRFRVGTGLVKWQGNGAINDEGQIVSFGTGAITGILIEQAPPSPISQDQGVPEASVSRDQGVSDHRRPAIVESSVSAFRQQGVSESVVSQNQGGQSDVTSDVL